MITMKNNIRLLIADDSKVMRDAITKMFPHGSNIQVVAEAKNGLEAIEATALYKPDVITMDVSMPGMDGLTALKHIMVKTPTPTIMLSSLTLEGSHVAFDSLRFGAVDFISKPSVLHNTDLSRQETEIRSKIEYAKSVELNSIKYIKKTLVGLSNIPEFDVKLPSRVVCIGSSEGGYAALLKIIPYLNVNVPFSYLVTMYATRESVDAFAFYLNQFSSVHVKRAEHDELLKPGVCYLNSGMDYMTVHKPFDNYLLHVSPTPFASRKGAIDMLLFSNADVSGEKSIAVILSGSGSDGAEGLEEVIRMGGIAITQNQDTALYKMMPTTAHDCSVGSIYVADKDIASTINNIHLKGDSSISQLIE